MTRNPTGSCSVCGKGIFISWSSAKTPTCRDCLTAKSQANRSRKQWIPEDLTCPTCGTGFTQGRYGQVYCTPEHRPRAAWRDKPRNPDKYGPAHAAARKDWAKRLEDAGQLPCSLCGEPVFAGSKWHLDHVPDTNDQYRGVAHPHCNMSEGAKRGVQIANRSPKRTRRDSVPLTLASGRTVDVQMKSCEACGKTCFGRMCKDCRTAARKAKPVSFGDQLTLFAAGYQAKQRSARQCVACGTTFYALSARYCSERCRPSRVSGAQHRKRAKARRVEGAPKSTPTR